MIELIDTAFKVVGGGLLVVTVVFVVLAVHTFRGK